MMSFLFVASGGFCGSILRFFIANKCHKHFIGTWIANITGSLLLALIYRFYLNGAVSLDLWHFIGIGFCGAYTTFSTFGNETIQLLLDKKFLTAISYIASSFIISLAVVYIVLSM